MPLPKASRVIFIATSLLMGCSFLGLGGGEADGTADTKARVLYYQLSSHPEKGWKLAEEENLKDVEKLIVISSTMLGFRRNLHFDKLVPFETQYLKKDGWHLISFEHREAAVEGDEAEDGDDKDGGGSLLVIKLEWLGEAGEVERASVEVKSPSTNSPSRDAFDALFKAYVDNVTAAEERAGNTAAEGGDAGTAAGSGAEEEPSGDAGT